MCFYSVVIDIDSNRALIATQVEGVSQPPLTAIAFRIHPRNSAARSQFTDGRFLWSAVRAANPAFVFDPVAINTHRAKGITFEAVYVDNRGVGRP